MPVYNAQEYLKEAIESILNQTFVNFEFIIVNDGSTDCTKEILDFYSGKDSRIKVLTQKKGGIVSALNNGLQLCKGEWVFRMDGDDIAISNRFQLQLNEIRKKSDLVLVGGFCEQINEDNVTLKLNKYPIKHKFLIRNLEQLKPFLPAPSICFRRVTVNEIGGYRNRFEYADDIDLWLRLVGKGKFSCVNAIIIKLRKHSRNYSNIHSKEFRVNGICAVVCHFRRKFGLTDPSCSDDKTWQKFRTWIELKLKEMGFFEDENAYQAIKNLWFANVNMSIIKRLASLLINNKINFLLVRYLYRRLFGDIAFKLAIQSKDLFE